MRHRERAGWLIALSLLAGGCSSSDGETNGPSGSGGTSSGGASGASSGGAANGAGGGNGATAGKGGVANAGGSGGTSAGGSGGTSGASGTGGDADGGDAGPAVPPHELLYVAGGNANGNGSTIEVYDVDTSTGVLVRTDWMPTEGLTSFLAFAGDRLYATDEDKGRLQAIRLDGVTGGTSALNAVDTTGHPTHVAVAPARDFVFAADYNEGSVEVIGADATGKLTTAADNESPGSQAHQVVMSPDGKFVFVPCKGADKVAQFRYTASSGKLDPNTPSSVASAQGAGPRHLAFRPDGRFAYVIDELGNTMETLSYDTAKGVFTRVTALTTLPAGFSGSSTAAEVAVSPSGSFVYGSNRVKGANGDLVIYSVESDGTLALVGHEGTRGVTPRHFLLDPSGRLLAVANLDSSQVVLFRVDETTGKLTFVTQTAVGMKPQFAGFAPAH